MRAPASAGVRVHGQREGGQPLPPVLASPESRPAGWERKQSHSLPGWRGHGQGEGGQVATGRAGVVIVTGRWRAHKDSKNTGRMENGSNSDKFFQGGICIFF